MNPVEYPEDYEDQADVKDCARCDAQGIHEDYIDLEGEYDTLVTITDPDSQWEGSDVCEECEGEISHALAMKNEWGRL